GTDWEDYTGVGVVSGTTNANGLIEFGPLPTGAYKVVETSTAAGFVSNTEEYYGTANEDGEFSINAGDDEGIAIGVTNEAETYSVTYDSNGGTGSQGDATAYRYNADVSVLGQSNLSKTGYDFAGWNTRADGTGTTYVAGTGTFKITANTTLYAKWNASGYAINYELDGGVNAASNPATYTFGAGVASFANATKTGHTFGGWYSDAALTTAKTSISTTETGAVTLYAKWSANDYNITYELNGGTNDVLNPTSYTYGIGITSFEDATKVGYVFAGWYSDAALTSSVTSISTTDIGNKALYAKWNADDNVYKVEHYIESLASGNYDLYREDNMNAKTDATADFADTPIVGFKFVEDKTTYEDSNNAASDSSISVSADGSLVIKLYYAREVYMVSYDGNTHTSGKAPSVQKVKFEDSIKIKKPSMKKSGYDFVQWKVNPTFKPGDTLTMDATMLKHVDENNVLTLKAQWKKTEKLPDTGRSIFYFLGF
ncbi:putative repeat protein (TIGR02543 family), partial [Bacilli bacterium PM5-9]|nr:putative repeat protein (TIGR02543 family) [Bacilli bacterium PM5-9]